MIASFIFDVSQNFTPSIVVSVTPDDTSGALARCHAVYCSAYALSAEMPSTGTIDGLWSIAFGNGFQQQPATTPFFAAGHNGEGEGLLGGIDALPGGDDQGGDND